MQLVKAVQEILAFDFRIIHKHGCVSNLQRETHNYHANEKLQAIFPRKKKIILAQKLYSLLPFSPLSIPEMYQEDLREGLEFPKFGSQ